jgi:hypothetical protein
MPRTGRPRRTKGAPVCHPELPYYANRLCKRCYDRDAQRLSRLRKARYTMEEPDEARTEVNLGV